MTDDTSNTGQKQAKKGTFTKGDPRINRKGRPKSFDQLRALAQSLANEQARGPSGEPVVVNGVLVYEAGKPILVDGHIATQTEVILRGLMRNNPERFIEITYGKVPDELKLSGVKTIRVDIEYGGHDQDQD